MRKISVGEDSGTVMMRLRRRSVLKATGAMLAWPLIGCLSSGGFARAQSSDKSSPLPFALKVANYIYGVRFSYLDKVVVDRAKEQLIYHVGLAFKGALTPNGRQAVDIARTLGMGRRGASIIGHTLKAPPLEAAFANSMFIRALGLDDALNPSATHPGVLTFPVALAVGEAEQCTGKEFITAVATAYEVVGKMTIPQDSQRAPRRPSMPFGPFASVTAAAKLMKLNPEQTANAIGYAADTAMGLKAGHEQQPTHIYGWIARNAITAAVVAKAGGETSPTILEEEYGFYQAMAGSVPDTDDIVTRLGKDPEILRATQKRYPGTASNIFAIEAVRSLIQAHHLNANNVAHVHFELSDWRKTFKTSTAKGPFSTRTRAESSLPFQTAILLLDGRQDLARYDQLDNPEILAITSKMSKKLIPTKNNRYAKVRITTVDGRIFEREKNTHTFPPLDPVDWLLSDGEKFVIRKNLEEFAQRAQELEREENIAELMTLLVPGK